MANLNGLLASWMSHRKALIELLDTLENEHLDYKPWDQAMSLSELVLHITTAMDMFVNTVKNGQFTPPPPAKSVESISDLKATVQEQTEHTKSEILTLTDEQLEKIVEFSGMNLPGYVLLNSAKDHEVHHKGQLFTYARLLGVESLPFFISRS